MTEPLAACVLTQSCFETDADVVARKVEERFGHLGTRATVHIAATPGTARYALEVDGIAVLVIYTGVPIPQDIVTSLAPNLFEAEAPPLEHRDRAIVTLLHDVGEGDVAEGHEATLRAALALLRVTAVLAEADDATAVYWLPSEMLMSAGYFTRVLAEAAEPGDVPTAILCRFIPYEDQGGFESRQGVAVLGLHRFIGRDIEFAPTALPINLVVRYAYDTSSWLLQKGPVFADGDTCGGSETEIIRIRHAERGRISPHPVLDLTIETLDPSDLAKTAAWSN